MAEMQRIGKRRRRLRTVGEPHPWEPRHMRLAATRQAESLGDARGRRNVALGVIQHLWRSPVPFVGFYVPEGVRVTENRLYTPAPPKLVDDAEYLAGVESHKKAYARDLECSMLPAGNLRGYFEVPTDEGWGIVVDLAEKHLELSDAWGLSTGARRVVGDLAPFVWAYRRCGFCILTLYDKDIGELRDDLLFVAKRQGIELRWRRTAA
ncbi:MAG TPA: hypothetical protein VHF46_02980 [Rubrobacteraceae bacterium]|nr:hypothetical protein [Rubrobacteraceae bacterium]